MALPSSNSSWQLAICLLKQCYNLQIANYKSLQITTHQQHYCSPTIHMKNHKLTELPIVRFNELLSKNENKQPFYLASFCCPPPPLFLVFNRIELRRVAHSKCLAIREGTNGCNLCRRVHRHKPLDAHLSCTATML